jgi:L-threonylcarbamoyladenylate synthase
VDTRVFNVKDKSIYWEHLNEAADALRKGEIVAFPTETVYGLGVNADLEVAVKGLYAVKQRPQEKEFARIIADFDEIDSLLEKVRARHSLAPAIQRLIERFWPGPLTIVFSGYGNRDIGIRFPDHEVARDLVRLSKVPVLATSANVSGMPPATNAQEVMASMGGKIKIILDGGPCTLKVPSTVVKISVDSYEILRIGAISEEVINECLKEYKVTE